MTNSGSLNLEELRALWPNIRISSVHSTGSTNSDLLEQLCCISPHFEKIFLHHADIQTAGRGRLQRTWHSEKNHSLTFSLAWFGKIPYNLQPLLSLLCSMAIREAVIYDLPSDCAAKVKLKWPNDVLIGHKKLAGILIETKRHDWFVIGVGINILLPSQLTTGQAACLNMLRTDLDLQTLLIRCVSALLFKLQLLIEQDCQHIAALWAQHDAYSNCKVALHDQGQIVAEGVYRGINEQGYLLLETTKGLLRQYSAGDLSLRELESAELSCF